MNAEITRLVLSSVYLGQRSISIPGMHTVRRQTFAPFNQLQLSINPGDAGMHLFRLCSDGQVADTWHPSFEDAFHQAEFEFRITKHQWTPSRGLSMNVENCETASEFFKRRAGNADGSGLIAFLENAPNVEADENDRL